MRPAIPIKFASQRAFVKMSVTFDYRARTPSGEPVSGTMRALDRSSALLRLRERMLIPSSIRASSKGSLARLLSAAKPRERLAFFRAYALLERSGIDFSTSFSLLVEQSSSRRMREALESIRFDVERGGEKLWAAMAHRPDEFSDLEIAMVAAGEEAGNREDVFERLATFLERDERMRKQLASALFYPFLVLVAAGLVSIYLVTFVVPQFAKLFDSFGVTRSPLLTMLVDLTTLATNPVVEIVLIASVATSAYVWSRTLATPEGAHAFDAIRLRVPFAGQVIRKTVVARTCRVIATLLEAGVNQVRALEVSVPVAESPVYARALDAARERIVDGRSASLEEALRESELFPPLVLGFIRVGASAGNVPSMLTKVAQYYEDDVEALLSAVPAVVQTAVTLGLGAVVGLIVYVVYIPLSTLSSSIH